MPRLTPTQRRQQQIERLEQQKIIIRAKLERLQVALATVEQKLLTLQP